MVEGEEAGEDFLVREGFGGFGPAVGGEDGAVEGAVGVGQPLGAVVVELGEGAVLEVGLGDAGRVQPGVAQADEFAGGFGDGFYAWVFGFGGFFVGRPGEREGVES